MTMTLGEALASSDGNDLDVDNSLVSDGYDAAKKELPTERKRLDYEALGDSLKRALMTALDIALDNVQIDHNGGCPEIAGNVRF